MRATMLGALLAAALAEQRLFMAPFAPRVAPVPVAAVEWVL